MKTTERLRFNAERGFAALFLAMGALYVGMLLLQAPDILKGIFSGDRASGRVFLMGVTIGGLCWLQWQYRHVVYPMHRKIKALA